MTASGIALGLYGVVVLAAFVRSRAYGVFAAIVLMFPTLVGNALREALAPADVLIDYAQIAAYLHFGALLVRPALRPLWFRTVISIPALWFVAACFLAFPWAIWAAFGDPIGAWIPFDILLDGVNVDGLARATASVTRNALDRTATPTRTDRPLRVVQITDPHLGPFMSIARLRDICRRAVEQDPDLILITGDLMTMESHDVDVVTAALAPLAGLRGRVFACHGNHDHEARAVVARAYAAWGITLLVDEATLVTTPAGAVQIIGADFVWRGRDEHLDALAKRHPRTAGALRLWLLHDPGAFKHIPPGDADLVLSGHTHGGHVGLVSLGLQGTFLSAVSSMPDHGLWARGTDRLYVHRANGHYGFPIRLGVPAEESVLHIWRPT
jgi:predicted MPP superfamily phosphohydrolase